MGMITQKEAREKGRKAVPRISVTRKKEGRNKERREKGFFLPCGEGAAAGRRSSSRRERKKMKGKTQGTTIRFAELHG